MFFALKILHPHHHQFFPDHHSSQITKQGWLIRQLQTQNICLLLTMLLFRVANGETFFITLKSKTILIRIFPTLTIKHQVLGSPFTGRDLLIGFDLLHQIPSLRWSSKGLMHKQHLLAWTQVPHLFTVDPFDSLKLLIINDCYANSHFEFLLKIQILCGKT